MPQVSLAKSLLAVPLIALLASGCSSLNSAMGGVGEKEALAALQWNYGAAALRLVVQTDATLNNYDGEAHSVVLAVVQTSEPGPFYQQLEEPDAAAKLLQGEKPPTGLLQVTRFALEPGRNAQIQLDRAQSARYVGVIAGFYDVPLAKTSKLFNLPVALEKKGLVVRDTSASPALAEVRLKLGPADIANAQIVALPTELPGKGEASPPTLVGAVRLNDLSEP